MVKFSTKDDSGYKKVLNSIEMLLERLGEDSVMFQNEVCRDFVHFLHVTRF